MFTIRAGFTDKIEIQTSVDKVREFFLDIRNFADLMPGIASIVDAYPSAASAMAAIRPHIESHGSPKCPRVHQEDNCALCQFVSGVVAIAPSDAHARAACAQSFVVAVAPELLPTWLVDGDPSLPRAPPEKA
jgi:hypothetical protein